MTVRTTPKKIPIKDVTAACRKHPTMKAAAEALGISTNTLRSYKKKYKSVENAIMKSRAKKGDPRGRPRTINKRFLVKKIIEHRGLITPIAKDMGCAYQTVCNYLAEYPEINQVLVEVKEGIFDKAEGNVFDAIDSGDVKMSFQYLKTKGRSRGYATRSESMNVNVNLTPEQIASMTMEELELLEGKLTRKAVDADGTGSVITDQD